MENRKELIRAYKERTLLGGVYTIVNTQNQRRLILSDTDLQGCKNLFAFTQMSGDCPYSKLREDWKTFGKEAFALEVLEELEKKPDQTEREFKEDLATLEGLHRERYPEEQLY